MAEHPLHHGHRHPRLKKQQGTGVPEVMEPREQLHTGRLKVVLAAYAPTQPSARDRCGSSSTRRRSWLYVG